MYKVTAKQFYKVWNTIVKKRKIELLDVWYNSKSYTDCILVNNNSIINEVSEELKLLCYSQDYYSLDAVLYNLEDRVPGTSRESCWLRNIAIAIEHENNFKGGLFKEVSHLMITNCHLRVLITYPEQDTREELKYLHQVIKGNRQSQLISEEEGFLIIFGYEDFSWDGFIYKNEDWIKIE